MTAPKPRRRTIRFAIVAVVCMLLGAVTTVGVAWWCAWPGYARWQPLHVNRPHQVVLTEWDAIYFARGGLRVTHVQGYPTVQRRSTTTVGLPFQSLRSVRHDSFWPNDFTRTSWRFCSWEEGATLPYFLDWNNEGLPLWPLFPGFAVDTAVYAAAWYLLIFTPLPLIRAGRRRFRVSRGMCPACAYDLKGAPTGPCPECGRAG